MKLCGNCGSFDSCVYRNIQSPCMNWRPGAETKTYRKIAQKCKGQPMSRYDVMFVDSMIGREVYTTNMKIRLNQLFGRLFPRKGVA